MLVLLIMKNKISFKIIILLFILLSTLPIGILFSVSILDKLKNDANTINSIGFIRGSTQRLSICLSDIDKKNIISLIEKKFTEVDISFENENKEYLDHSDFDINYTMLKEHWKELKNAFLQNASQERLATLSKACWESADKTTDAAQAVSHKKNNKTLLTILFIGSFIFVLLVTTLYIIHTDVRNKLEVNVIIDPLTSLYNRSYLFQQLNSTKKSYSRTFQPFCLIFIDIDNFKNINDTFGHKAGDEVLKNFSLILKNNLREDDIAFRYGGEEFIILSKNSNTQETYILAERLRKSVEKFDFNSPSHITISIGISEFSANNSIDILLTNADNAMYQAKQNGKNQTCVHRCFDKQ